MTVSRRQFLGTGIVGGAVAAALGCSRPAPAPLRPAARSPWEDGVAALEARIPELMRTLQVPGVSMALIREARIAWTRSFGVRDRSTAVPVDDGTVFSGQSMSKPVFAYRVMKLCELGVLDLDAPLTNYTPDEFVTDDPRLREITARRVLSHTTGLPNWRTPEEPLRINFAPGTKWSYSGEGYHYLQSVVTRLVGHSEPSRCGTYEMGYRVCATDFGDYMKENILRPFGMTRSGYVWTPEMQSNLARRHGADGKPMPAMPSTAVDVARYGSAGSLMTTAIDFAKFLLEVMDPKSPDGYRLNDASRKEMLTPQVEVPAPVKASWALGWQIWHLDTGDLILHGGDDTGWHSQSAFSPTRQTGFVILTNGEGGRPLIWDELLKPLVEIL